MKTIRLLAALTAFMLFFCPSAGAAGLSGLTGSGGTLPDPAELIGEKAFLYEEEVIHDGILFVAFTFPMPNDYEGFVKEYEILAKAAGYTVSDGVIMNTNAIKISSGVKTAWLVPRYRGALLFLVNATMDYAPLPTPSPTPRPTPKPTPKPVVSSAPNTGGSSSGSSYIPSTGGHTEYIEVKQDCFACVGGRCGLCNGSGWYRNYGEKVPCSIYCQTCDGLGYWYTRQPIWVP